MAMVSFETTPGRTRVQRTNLQSDSSSPQEKTTTWKGKLGGGVKNVAHGCSSPDHCVFRGLPIKRQCGSNVTQIFHQSPRQPSPANNERHMLGACTARLLVASTLLGVLEALLFVLLALRGYFPTLGLGALLYCC
jgi:hypothetical protein